MKDAPIFFPPASKFDPWLLKHNMKTWFHNSTALYYIYISQFKCKLSQRTMILSKYSQVFIRNQNSWLKFPSLKVYEVIFYVNLDHHLACTGALNTVRNQNNTGSPNCNPNQSPNSVVTDNAWFSKKLNMILSNYYCLGEEKTRF